MIAGTSLTVVSVFSLGRSFAILPAVRTIVVGGPYRFVRHPIYLGELTMILACFVANKNLFSLFVFVTAIALVAIRIVVEERLLVCRPEYVTYHRSVKWRLIPRIW